MSTSHLAVLYHSLSWACVQDNHTPLLAQSSWKAARKLNWPFDICTGHYSWNQPQPLPPITNTPPGGASSNSKSLRSPLCLINTPCPPEWETHRTDLKIPTEGRHREIRARRAGRTARSAVLAVTQQDADLCSGESQRPNDSLTLSLHLMKNYSCDPSLLTGEVLGASPCTAALAQCLPARVSPWSGQSFSLSSIPPQGIWFGPKVSNLTTGMEGITSLLSCCNKCICRRP